MNPSLFQTRKGGFAPTADTVNEAGGVAYRRTPQQLLAQLAITGTLSNTFYSTAEVQLDNIVGAALECDLEYVAKVAIYARKFGHMKDVPAFLVAHLFVHDEFDKYFTTTFRHVIDNGRMLRNFVQVIRSNALERRSFGSRGKRAIQEYLLNRPLHRLLNESVGQTPSLSDIIKMVHPEPRTEEQEAFFGMLIGKPYDSNKLPAIALHLEAWHAGEADTPPAVEFRLLTGETLSREAWVKIAMDAGWHATRMNLNTFLRHGVFESKEAVNVIAAKLADRDAILKQRVFPYQLLTAYLNIDTGVPVVIQNALQDALDISLENIPTIDGQVVVGPDVSGSMSSTVTGYRSSGPVSKTRCSHVSALVAAAFLHKNPETIILPFDTRVHVARFNPRDSVMTVASQIQQFGGGGTNCALPLSYMREHGIRPDLYICVSDNESWLSANSRDYRIYGNSRTDVMDEWTQLHGRYNAAKMVCVDIQPNTSVQAVDRPDIMNIGGFSDTVFSHIADFAQGGYNPDTWVENIERYAERVLEA